MRVLVACEFSGRVREAFSQRGHTALSVDLLPSEQPGNHYQGDFRQVLGQRWDLLVAHPPCRFLANSGVWSSRHNPEQIRQAANFFNELLNANIPHICVENPIQHKYARELIPRYSQIVQPWQFGHTTKKATCLWLKNLALLKPTSIIPEDKRTNDILNAPDSKGRAKNRSRTFQGLAEAMAKQWG